MQSVVMSYFSFAVQCHVCGAPSFLCLSQKPIDQIEAENKDLQTEIVDLQNQRSSLSDQLSESQALAAWDSLEGRAIANLD